MKDAMEEFDNSWIFRQVEMELKRSEKVRIRLTGQSMYPFLLSDRDILTISPTTEGQLKRGDIVLARHPDNGTCFLHRFIDRINDGICILQGDANIENYELVREEFLIGKLMQVERDETILIDCESFSWRLKGFVWVKLRGCRKTLLKLLSYRRCIIHKYRSYRAKL